MTELWPRRTSLRGSNPFAPSDTVVPAENDYTPDPPFAPGDDMTAILALEVARLKAINAGLIAALQELLFYVAHPDAVQAARDAIAKATGDAP